MRFFPGLHHPGDARHFDAAFVSINAIRSRKSDLVVGDWILDSGGFTEIKDHGRYRLSVADYAGQIRRWARCGRLLAAASQDFMCSPLIRERLGLAVPELQRMTIERYGELLREDLAGVYLMPILQGWEPQDYVAHVRAYGDRLAAGAWVGVGSIASRSRRIAVVGAILHAIKEERPDLRLHGFGLKKTSLAHPLIRALLASADSNAWSFHARINGRNGNDWREAMAFERAIVSRPMQSVLDFLQA